MKKIVVTLVLAIAGIVTVPAQQMPPIPVDPDVRIGKLDNGLTYYIRHNNWPENRAEFYIAQKVGSIQEDDNQRGLAHFLERRGGHHPAQRELARVGIERHARLVQQLAYPLRRLGGKGKNAVHGATAAPGAQRAPIRPPADQKLERPHQDRLARAGFARDHVEPRGEFQFFPFDQREVVDFEVA